MALSTTQLANRAKGLGGSDAAAATNLSRWKSPYRLWREKTGNAPPANLDDNEAVRFGSLLENVVADEFARRRGVRVQRERRTLHHARYPWMLAHIDRRVVGVREGLECKTASLRMVKEWGEEDTDQVPVEYIAQATHYMAITGWTAWHIAVLIAGSDFRMYRVERDEELVEDLILRESQFWRCVETRTPPEPTTLDDAFARWPQDSGREVLVSPEIATAVQTLQQYKQQMGELEGLMEQSELLIKNFMGDATALIAPESIKPLVTWKTQQSNRVDIRALRATYPNIAAEMTKTSSTRVFRMA